jgi:RHS repeat-associated protein
LLPDPEHPHAVAEVQRPGGTDTYNYDASGNVTTRTEAGVTYNQTTNAEGSLASVTNTGTSEAWTFVYDGDGNRIRQDNPDGTGTLFLAGGLYEVSLSAGGQETGVRKYYAIAGQRVAMVDATGTYFLVTDHLGSVVAVTDETAALVCEQRYKPFGQPRLSAAGALTDFGFTGQRGLAGAGLQDFNARWFDTSLGMFASADPLIPDLFNPQALNRYGFVLNNPLRFTDPTGMFFCEDTVGRCTPPPRPRAAAPPRPVVTEPREPKRPEAYRTSPKITSRITS